MPDPRYRHMILFTTHPARAAQVRPLWNTIAPGAGFVATARADDAALGSGPESLSLVVIDSDSDIPWVPLMRYVRRNAPATPVLVFGHLPGQPGLVIEDWDQLPRRLTEIMNPSGSAPYTE